MEKTTSNISPTNIKAHFAMLGTAVAWGLMAPFGKMAMDNGVTGLMLANMRMFGAAVCFWITSLFLRHERVARRDLLLLFFASLFGIVFNQGCYTLGLSLTSPVDTSIITTTTPIATLVFAAIFLKEPVTAKKIIGVLLGCAGALALVSTNSSAGGRDGSILGDALCLFAQTSFALYLTLFKNLIARYNYVTLMKWMFTYAALCFIPVSFRDFAHADLKALSVNAWLEVGYVVFIGTFLAYSLMVTAQKTLRPTVVSMYNYIQPIVGCTVSIIAGMAAFGWTKAAAAAAIFLGVYIVTQSKSRAQVINEKNGKAP